MNKKEFEKYIKRHSEVISKIEKRHFRILTAKQKELFERIQSTFLDKLERDEDGNVVYSESNVLKLSVIDVRFQEMARTKDKEMIRQLVGNVNEIVDYNKKYYSAIDGNAKVEKILPKVNNFLSSWIGVKDGKASKNGFIDQLINDSTVKHSVKNLAMKIVVGQTGFEDAKKQLRKLIEGEGEKLGAFEKHYKTFANDLYSQIDRATSDVLRTDLKLEFAVYEGGLIKTSRKFCQEHNGEIYHISEIEKFKPDKGIPPDYSPITDLGGYNCRHHLNWISNAMAKAMGKDVDKFIDDQTKPTPKPKPEVEKEIIEEAVKETVLELEKEIENIKNNTKAREYLKNTFGTKSATISSKIELSELKQRIQQVRNLMAEYNTTNTEIEKITFSSTSRFYGVISYYFSGKIIEANFGHMVGTKESRTFYEKDASKNLSRTKSSVDIKNLRFATTVHEFAHLMTTTRRNSVATLSEDQKREFWKKVSEVRSEYNKELNSLLAKDKRKEAGEIYLGRYAGTNVDEFMAESFASYKLSEKPSKYAKKVGEIVDEYFLKNKK